MSTRRRLTIAVLVWVGAVGLGAVLSVIWGYIGADSSGNCFPESTAIVCIPVMQTVVAVAPLFGWTVAAALSGWGVFRIEKIGVIGWRPIAWGAAVMATTLVATRLMWLD